MLRLQSPILFTRKMSHNILRHKILKALADHEISLTQRRPTELEVSRSAQEIASAIGVELRPVQMQIIFLVSTEEIKTLGQVPPPRYYLEPSGAGAHASDKYLLEHERERGIRLDANWRVVTGWVAIVALVVATWQSVETGMLERRVYELEHPSRVSQAAEQTTPIGATSQAQPPIADTSATDTLKPN